VATESKRLTVKAPEQAKHSQQWGNVKKLKTMTQEKPASYDIAIKPKSTLLMFFLLVCHIVTYVLMLLSELESAVFLCRQIVSRKVVC